MGASYPAPVRHFAESYYVLDGKTLAEISAILGVSEPTLRRWRADDRWDERKMPRALSSRFVSHDLLLEIWRIKEKARAESRPVSHEEADAIVKLQATADKLDPKARFRAHALDTIELLSKFLAEQAPELHEHIIPHLVEFSRRVVEHPVP